MAVLVGPPTHHNNAIPGFHRWQHGAVAHSCMAEVDTLEGQATWEYKKGWGCTMIYS